MNRGLFVSRGEPDIEELVVSAEGICNYDQSIFACIKPHVREIAQAYLELCETARQFKREFFGLRDYYSLIKMLYSFCSRDKNLTWYKLEHAIKRNFNGLAIDIMAPFQKHLQDKLDTTQRYIIDPESLLYYYYYYSKKKKVILLLLLLVLFQKSQLLLYIFFLNLQSHN